MGKVNQLMQAYSWTDKEVLMAVQSKFRGVAKEWLDAQPLFNSWVELADGVTRDFPSVVRVAEIHRDMARRKRKQGETVQEFNYAMLNTGRKGNLDEPSIIT